MSEISFGALVSPVGLDQFQHAFCSKQFVHISQDARERLEHLVPWEGVRHLFSQNVLDRKRLRVARGGRDVPPNFYRKEGERDLVDTDKLRAVLEQDASIVVNGAQDVFPPVRRLARQIEVALGHKVNVNAYLTFGLGGAFSVHYDTHDVLVLQVHGDKRWFIYDQAAESPLVEHKVVGAKPPPKNVLHDFVLRSGDAIYVPRGVYHRAEVTDNYSVHLTFGIHTVKGIDLIDSLREQAAKEPLFREDIQTIGGVEALKRHDRRLKDRLIQLIEASSAADLIGGVRSHRRRVSKLWLGPPLRIDDETRVASLVRQSDLSCVLKDWGGSADDVEVGRLILRQLAAVPWLPVAAIRPSIVLDSGAFFEVLGRLVQDCYVEIVE